MNNVDKQYLDLLKDILENGTEKETRAGRVKSVFGRMMRFDLKEGFPLLTTKKVFTKGIIHELLWFLSGNTNIKYLVDNNVNIWNDDAYRYYKTIIEKHNRLCENPPKFSSYARPMLPIYSKEDFIEHVKNGDGQWVILDEAAYLYSYTPNTWEYEYKFGDLGPVYGKQWRSFGVSQTDQIKNIIDTLKTNPDDRRMLCIAFNPDVLGEVALPPCHVMMQFYTRELTPIERLDWLCEHSNGEYDEWKSATHEQMDELNVPRRELSCMWTQRSVDVFLGWGFNLSSYGLLTHMIAQVCNMAVGELVCSLGDTHIYMEHMDAVQQQLQNDPKKYELPKLKLNTNIKNIDDFTFNDIKIENYQSYPNIKAKLLVG